MGGNGTLVAFAVVAAALLMASWFSSAPPAANVISKADVQALIEADDPLYLIDVRSPAEHAGGSIPRSVNVPLPSLPDVFDVDGANDEFWTGLGLPAAPTADTQLVVFCRSGARSTRAAGILERLGFANVKNYKGSMIDWNR